MFPRVSFGRYFPAHSILHQASPLLKFICLIFLLFGIFMAQGFGLILLAGVLGFLCYASKIPFQLYRSTLRNCLYFFLAYTVLNLLIGVSYSTIFLMAFRFFGTIIVSSILLFTTKPMDLNLALEQFFSPLKRFSINITYITFSITLAIHFLPVVFETAEHIMKALVSAGCSFWTASWRQKMQYSQYFFLPLFLISFRKSDQFAEVLEVKQFSLETKRTYYRSFPWKWYDSGVLLGTILLMFILIVWR